MPSASSISSPGAHVSNPVVPTYSVSWKIAAGPGRRVCSLAFTTVARRYASGPRSGTVT